MAERLTDRGTLVIDIRKLENYCLDPAHPRGRHKARVFQSVLGIAKPDAGWLQSALLVGAKTAPAEDLGLESCGRQWRADIPVTRQGKTGVIRTLWLERLDEPRVRLVTCWVL
jgi:hypothetical protein